MVYQKLGHWKLIASIIWYKGNNLMMSYLLRQFDKNDAEDMDEYLQLVV